MPTTLTPEERKLKAKERAKKARQIRESLLERSVSPKTRLFSALITTAISVALVLFLLFLLETKVSWNTFNGLTVSGLSILIIYGVFLKNFHEIPVGYKGVLLSFGERTQRRKPANKRKLYNEGIIWVLPYPLQSLKIVDLREQTEKIDDKVITAVGTNKDGKEVQAEMLVNSATQWMVKDPYTFLDVGEEDVLIGLRTATVSAEREVASNTAPRDFLQMKEELGEAVDEAATAQADRWGIEIFNVNIPYIRFANPETARAFEQAAIEESEKEAGAIETDNFFAIANRYKEFGLEGPDAIWAAHRQENKVAGQEIHFSGNQTSDFLGGLALTAGKDKK